MRMATRWPERWPGSADDHTSPVLFSSHGTGISDGIELQTGTLGGSFSAKLAAALKSLEVKPFSFILNVNTIQLLARLEVHFSTAYDIDPRRVRQ